jgi:hypothetical protein
MQPYSLRCYIGYSEKLQLPLITTPRRVILSTKYYARMVDAVRYRERSPDKGFWYGASRKKTFVIAPSIPCELVLG